MLLSILIVTVGLVLLLLLEGFLVTLASFSVLILVLLVLENRINWKQWMIFTLLSSVLVDILLHRAIGVTLFAFSTSTLFLHLIFLVVPKEKKIASYMAYFLSIFLFYTLLTLTGPFIQDRTWGILTLNSVLADILKAVISSIIIFITDLVISNFRANEQIRL